MLANSGTPEDIFQVQPPYLPSALAVKVQNRSWEINAFEEIFQVQSSCLPSALEFEICWGINTSQHPYLLAVPTVEVKGFPQNPWVEPFCFKDDGEPFTTVIGAWLVRIRLPR